MDSVKKPGPDEINELKRQLAQAEAALNAASHQSLATNDQGFHAKVERTHQLSVEDYRSLFDNMTEGFALHEIVCDEQGTPSDYRILELNPSFERLTGIKREMALGRLATEVLPGLEPFWIETYGKVALTGQPVQFDHYTQTLDKYYRVYAYRPAPGQFAVMFMDITEIKQAELRLNAIAEKYGTLFNTTSDGVFIHNLAGEILEVNDAYCLMSGYSRVELTRMFISELDAGETPREISKHIHKLLKQSGHDRLESTHRRKDGSTFDVDITALYFDKEGGRIAIFVRDITDRKRAQARLAYLASFPERNPNPVVDVDLEGRIRYANPAALRLFPDLIELGLEHPWLVDLDSIMSRFHQDNAEVIVRDIAIRENFYQQAIHYITQDRLIRIYGLEITKRKQAEAALQARERQLSRAQEISHVGSWELDLIENHLSWSNETYRIFGYPPQEFTATYEAFLEAVHPDDRAAVDTAYSSSIRDGLDSYEIEHRLVNHSSGEVRVVREKCIHFRDETGKVIRSEGMVHDVTEQRRSEEALRLSEEKYRTMVETAAEGIVLAQPDGEFFYVNQQMASMLGYPVNEILGKNGSDFIYENNQPLVQQLRNKLHKGDILHGEIHFRRKDGSELWSMYNASPVFNDKGEHFANIAMHTDITERKQAEGALRKAYDELDQRVQQRTQELDIANKQLRAEIREHEKSKMELESSLHELQVVEEELRSNNEMLLDAQKILDAERQRYRDLFDLAPDGYVVTDNNGKVLEANQFAAKILGISHQNLIGKPLLVFITQNDHASYNQLLLSLSRQPGVHNLELRLQPRVGSEITSSVTVATAKDKENKGTLRWTIRNITERKRAEEIIRQNSLRNAVLSEVSLSLAEASLDEKAILDIVVRTTARLVGDCCVITMASEDGQWLDPVAWHHHKPRALELMNALFASTHHQAVDGPTGQVYRTSQPLLVSEINPATKSAEISPGYQQYVDEVGVASLLIVPLQIGSQTIGTMGLSRDTGGRAYTSEDQVLVDILANRTAQTIHNARLYQELQNALRKELEVHDQLVQSEKFAAVGRLLASITHEINNPLQTIKNCLYLSWADVEPTSPLYEYLRIASTETDRLSNLVAQLREIYRPPTQGQSKPVNLPSLIDEVQILLVSYLQEKHVIWEVIPPDADWISRLKVEGVADQLKQIFLNISLNAIDAMEPDGGSIKITFMKSQAGDTIGICFRDTGPGLPQEVQAKLFEPFTTTKEKGLGLGLTICYDLIQKHHGRIEVESEPGEGSAFTIWLPVSEEKA